MEHDLLAILEMPPPSHSERGSNTKRIVGVLALAAAAAIGWRLLRDDTAAIPSGASTEHAPSDERSGTSAAPVAAAASSGPVAPNAAQAGSSGGYFARFGWGSGKGELGKDRPDEANPEGPMSFALLPSGGLAILDQVNGRVVLTDKDGNPVKEIKVGLSQAQELAVGKDGTLAVADRLVDQRVQIFDPNGKEGGSLPLLGSKLREGGAMTGLFVDGNSVYAENGHGILALLGTTDGVAASPQTDLFGRPSRDGTLLLSAGITNKEQGRAWVSAMKRAETKELWTRELKESAPLLSISMLDSDARGIVYIAYTIEPSPGDERLLLRCLSPKNGQVIGTTELQLSDMPEESFREFSVADDGTVYHAEMTEQGMAYRTVHCP